MQDKRQKKKEIDPEILMKKKFRAKCQFRALIRLVMANTYWMMEDLEEYEGVDDVKRRVQQAVRGKAKKKQLLTIKDKALLNKPAEDRTDHEKKYIYRIIGGLKCFKKYPNHVKKKLAAVTYFKYYSPGRVIVRQHQEAHALYFIVSGDVGVSHLVYDELINEHVSVEIGVMHTGDMFGEVSLLHNILRTATCTTIGHCELLALMKEDFKNVLQASVQKQWDLVSHAMSAFTYFDGLDEVARREGCIVAKMKSYEINETILGDGVGIPNFVYFTLSGRCQMIEALQVIVTTRLGKNYYTLYDPFVPKEESEQDLDKKYFGAYKNLNANKDSRSVHSTPVSAKEIDGSQKERTSMIVPNATESILKPPSSSKHERMASVSTEKDVKLSESSAKEIAADETMSIKSQVLLPPSETQGPRESVRLSVIPEQIIEKTRPNLTTYFMQVCQFNPGSSFGFGENMRDRRIVALTPVDCMLMPMIWLLQRNTANIWTRIQHYLEKKIPNKKALFKEFVQERRWQEYRDQLVEDVVARANTVNWTSIHDVPYSIRMEEMVTPTREESTKKLCGHVRHIIIEPNLWIFPSLCLVPAVFHRSSIHQPTRKLCKLKPDRILSSGIVLVFVWTCVDVSPPVTQTKENIITTSTIYEVIQNLMCCSFLITGY